MTSADRNGFRVETMTSDQLALIGDLLLTGAGATTVLASFDNFDRRENINFRLIKDKKGWIVDEIATGPGTLSSVRQGKPSKC